MSGPKDLPENTGTNSKEDHMPVEELLLEKHETKKNANHAGRIVLSTRGIHKAFGGQIVLDDVSLDLRAGEVVLLKGENGSGKTTLLNILTGNLEPDRGEVHVDLDGSKERFVWPRQWWKELNPFDHFTPERLAWEGVGRVWQDIRLFPTMTTLENVAVAAQHQKGENPLFALASPASIQEEKKNQQQSAAWLCKLGLGGRLDSSCDKISLGQMKRVAIARAIHAGAKVLFLDEPLSGLDKTGVSEVMKYLEDLVQQHSITLVIVEHVYNIPTIMKLADTVWTLSNGRLSMNGTDEENVTGQVVRHDLQDLLLTAAGDQGKITSTDLPSGARLIVASPAGSDDAPVVFEVKDLIVKRGIRTVLDGLSIQLKKGQLAILEAPNGWGKSSLLDAIAGIHAPEQGSIRLNGVEINALPTHKRIKAGLAYLRSNQPAFTSLSVEEHRKLAGISGILFNGSLNNRSEGSFLSGGEKQKLLLDMLSDADVYLLDEPMIGLDEMSIQRVIERISSYLSNQKTVIITVPKHA